MKCRRSFALLLALILCLSPLSAIADTYKIEDSSITVHVGENGQTVNGTPDDAPVITNNDPSQASKNTVTITAEAGYTAYVTIQDVNIDASTKSAAAITTGGDGDVIIELDGSSTLKSATKHAGLQKENDGTLTIQDEDKDGSLKATGGFSGAGIGGGSGQDGSDISITGGTVEAQGGSSGAGIGGGSGGAGNNISISETEDGKTEVKAIGGNLSAGIGGGNGGAGSNITISGGTVEAQGGLNAAGIGGGRNADGSNVEITGGAVNAKGGASGAGIGGGYSGSGSGIEISETVENQPTKVTATGGSYGAGIGGGNGGAGSDITISGGAVVATSEDYGAGIGGGYKGSGTSIEISSGEVIAVGTEAGAGIGGGNQGDGSDITVSGDAQVSVAGGDEVDAYRYGTGAGIGDGGKTKYTAGTEVAPDTDGLYTTGIVTYYEAGTTVQQIENGTGTVVKSIHGTKDPNGKNENPFLQFNSALAAQILGAEENSALEVNAQKFPGFHRMVVEALGQRPDVSLTVTCWLEGNTTTLSIPAGLDLLTYLGDGDVLSFAEIAKLLG